MSILRTAPLALLVWICAAFAVSPRSDDPEELARDLLELAESKAAKSRYDKALDDYRELVQKYPGTEAARTAALRTTPNALLGWNDIERSGDSGNRVDVVIMGDGYTLKHLAKAFDPRAKDVFEVFDRNEILREYLSYFNFLRAAVVSAEDGIDGHGREADTALDAYVTSSTGTRFAAVKPQRVMYYLEQLPAHDGFAFVIVNDESAAVANAGVATIPGATNEAEDMIHSFGHGFAGLGDEFSDSTFHTFQAGDRPNLSASETNVPWQHWIDAKHPLIGVYEGGSGRQNDVFRPVASNCAMNAAKEFCPVCREAIVLAIYRSVDAIDACTPEPHERTSAEEIEPPLAPASDSRREKLAFEVKTMRPATHDLEVTWWVLPEHRSPRSQGTRLSHTDRAKRGPLPPIDAEPVHAQRVSKTGSYPLEIDPKDYAPGRYRVVCRAVDTTLLSGEKFPWVLQDRGALLQSERGWWIRIP